MKEFKIQNCTDYVVTDNTLNMKKVFAKQFPAVSEGQDEEDEGEDESDINEDTVEGAGEIEGEGDMMNELWQDLEEEMGIVTDTLDKNSHYQRLSCYAHTLQLVVGDRIRNIRCVQKAMTKISRMTTLPHTSGNFKDAFESNFGTERSIPAPNVTQ